MDLCPHRSPSVAAAGTATAGATSVARAGFALRARGAAGAVGVSPTAAASRRLAAAAWSRPYFASRMALWASSLLIVGSRERVYGASLTPFPRKWSDISRRSSWTLKALVIGEHGAPRFDGQHERDDMSETPIREHALLSDCGGAALVTSRGCVDWLCLPVSTARRCSRGCWTMTRATSPSLRPRPTISRPGRRTGPTPWSSRPSGSAPGRPSR